MNYIYVILVGLCLLMSRYSLGADSVSYYVNIIEQEEEVSEHTFKWLINHYATIDIDSSEYFARLAVDHFKFKRDSRLAFAYTTMGRILFKRRDLEEAQRYILKGIELGKELNDNLRVAIGYQSLANIQMHLNNDKDVVYYFKKAEKIFSEETDYKAKGAFYLDLGVYHWNKGNIDDAHIYYRKSLEEYRNANSRIGEINCLKGIGGLYYESGKTDSFQVMINKAILIAQELYDGKTNDLELTCYQNLALYFYNQGQYDSAQYYLDIYIDGNILTGNAEKLYEGYDFIAEIHEIEGNYKLAYSNLKISKNIYDSLTALSNHKEIVRVQRKYNYEIEEKKRINAELAAARANEQRIIYLFLIVAAILVIITLGLLYRARVTQNKKELVIKDQRINQLLRDQEIQSLNAMMEGQEQERNRVAKDLHDRLGVMLSTIKLNFSALEGRIDKIREENESHYKITQDLLDEAVEEVRRISRNLVSGVLTKFGLVPALEDLANNISASGQMTCEVIVTHMEERLSGNQEIAIYRVVQECIGNALKHSKANSIIIQLIRHDEELTVMVEDDGVGFKWDEILAKGKGMGLDNIKSRVNNLGGTCTFDTNPGQGTTIIAEIPIKTNS